MKKDREWKGHVCFKKKPWFKTVDKQQFNRSLTATSGHWLDQENSDHTGVIDQRDNVQGRAAVWDSSGPIT